MATLRSVWPLADSGAPSTARRFGHRPHSTYRLGRKLRTALSPPQVCRRGCARWPLNAPRDSLVARGGRDAAGWLTTSVLFHRSSWATPATVWCNLVAHHQMRAWPVAVHTGRPQVCCMRRASFFSWDAAWRGLQAPWCCQRLACQAGAWLGALCALCAVSGRLGSDLHDFTVLERVDLVPVCVDGQC